MILLVALTNGTWNQQLERLINSEQNQEIGLMHSLVRMDWRQGMAQDSLSSCSGECQARSQGCWHKPGTSSQQAPLQAHTGDCPSADHSLPPLKASSHAESQICSLNLSCHFHLQRFRHYNRALVMPDSAQLHWWGNSQRLWENVMSCWRLRALFYTGNSLIDYRALEQ